MYISFSLLFFQHREKSIRLFFIIEMEKEQEEKNSIFYFEAMRS